MADHMRGVRRPGAALTAMAAAGAMLAAPLTSWAQPVDRPAARAIESPADVMAARMGRGVNILSPDPIWRDPAKARFTAADFARIHDAGFRTVRVNLDAFSHMDAANQLDPRWLATLDWVVRNALANRLIVIVDEHNSECSVDLATCEPRLLAFWRQVGEHFRDAPDTVLFELLNEPHEKLGAEAWNGLLSRALATVRQTNPDRVVVIGPTNWNSIHDLSSLRLPPDDRNILVTVHYYLPMTFTHQGAKWNPATAGLSGVTWGTAEDEAQVASDFDGVQAWSRAERRPVLLGEFGAYDKGDMASRVRYTYTVARSAEARGWPWAYWQYDGDFIAFDMETHQWVQPILQALIPDSPAAR